MYVYLLHLSFNIFIVLHLLERCLKISQQVLTKQQRAFSQKSIEGAEKDGIEIIKTFFYLFPQKFYSNKKIALLFNH